MVLSYNLYDNTFIAVYVIVMAFIFGAIFASFITCAAWRVVRGEDWIHGHSHCDTCGHELSTMDLFPIISYIALKGKCRYCGAKVPPRDLIFEIALGLLFAGTIAVHGAIDPLVIEILVLEVLFLGLSLAEMDTGKAPSGFLLSILITWILFAGFMADVRHYVLEGVAASLAISVIMYAVAKLMSSARKQKVEIDIRPFAVCMLFTGLDTGVVALIAACLAGIVIMLISRKKTFAVTPLLSIGTVFALIFGESIIQALFINTGILTGFI
ncbi:MAG: prepilin peptidase [Saccharofermentans sp.]|nr:prepilin peptidase [Saccharofermentans sp.]